MKNTKNDRTLLAQRSLLPGLVCGAATLLLAAAGCKKAAPPPPPPPAVQVLEVTTTNAPAAVEFIGQLDSPQNVEIRARVEAFVDKMLFTEGTEVKEGDPLFKLDDKPYQERLKAAKAMQAEAEAALNKYQKDVDRLTPLAAKRAVPQQDLDNAVASVEVGKASVESAKARVDSATLDVGYCDVKSPVTGLIGAKQVSIGELVGKGIPTLMATISTLDPIWFYCNVSEVQYLRAEAETKRTGKRVEDVPAQLLLSDGSTHPEPGKIVFLDRAVDIKTGTLRVRVSFPNTTRVLRPGMFGRIRLDLGDRPNSILVPERAIVELQGKTFLWVISPDNKASQRPVNVGGQVGDRFMILKGIEPGERIVVEGLQKLREDGVVQPMTAQEMASAAQAAKEAEPAKAEGHKSAKE